MVKGIINAFDHMKLCFVINLTKDGNWAITRPPIFATRNVILLCSHSPNDVPPEPQRNVSIATVRGTGRPSNTRNVSFATTFLYQAGMIKSDSPTPRATDF